MNTNPYCDHLATDLAERGWSRMDGFLTRGDALSIRVTAMAYREEGAFKRAGIGKNLDFKKERDIRGDQILWIDDEHITPEISSYLERMEELKAYLNESCFLSIRDCEMHFAVYPPGARYARHSDRFRQQNHRIVSFVLYLNPGWQASDGGQLCLYPTDQPVITVRPEAGTLVCFRSDIEHEVLEALRTRYSLTGWFLSRPVELGFL